MSHNLRNILIAYFGNEIELNILIQKYQGYDCFLFISDESLQIIYRVEFARTGPLLHLYVYRSVI